ncbi:PIN domain-containing protein [Pontibacter sp. SGAir0037]|uniref:PIN domain-containing protein n=1 Tax=Pontibacter sp. SGAir0037 TaxID=2571030 RepID=UPI0010CCBB2E|nr:PIN domain-containing protein [Pontibacter sp. SGAir0037]QCR21122.1 PIN domain-containing protein [Pontibacter sp. SGAir0037]
MIHSPKFIAVLDACVLYPAPIRDLLLNLAYFDLYTPKWTDKIHEEWTRNLLLNRPELSAEQLQKTVDAMNTAFPDSNVGNYESIIMAVTLPDSDDCHVLAAAIRSSSEVIVTANIKDFPNEYLSKFDVEAQHPDYFISNLVDLNPEKALKAFQQQVSNLKKPPMSKVQVLENLKKVGLEVTSEKLLELI